MQNFIPRSVLRTAAGGWVSLTNLTSPCALEHSDGRDLLLSNTWHPFTALSVLTLYSHYVWLGSGPAAIKSRFRRRQRDETHAHRPCSKQARTTSPFVYCLSVCHPNEKKYGAGWMDNIGMYDMGNSWYLFRANPSWSQFRSGNVAYPEVIMDMKIDCESSWKPETNTSAPTSNSLFFFRVVGRVFFFFWKLTSEELFIGAYQVKPRCRSDAYLTL